MPDELKRIEALYGPYARRLIDIPEADAKQAIADGWARDPYAPAADPVEFDQEKHDAVLVAAEKAARKFRGETEVEKKEEKPKAKTPQETDRATTATTEKPGSTYQTRRVSTTKE